MINDFYVRIFDGHVDGVETAVIASIDLSAFGNQKSNDPLVSTGGRRHQWMV